MENRKIIPFADYKDEHYRNKLLDTLGLNRNATDDDMQEKLDDEIKKLELGLPVDIGKDELRKLDRVEYRLLVFLMGDKKHKEGKTKEGDVVINTWPNKSIEIIIFPKGGKYTIQGDEVFLSGQPFPLTGEDRAEFRRLISGIISSFQEKKILDKWKEAYLNKIENDAVGKR